jgi:LytS/YehU family sensor histidine kinase
LEWDPLSRLIGTVFLSLIFALLTSFLLVGFIDVFRLRIDLESGLDDTMFYLHISVNSFLFLLFWSTVHLLYYYLSKSKLQEVDGLQLRAKVKSLELKNINSYINPHFVFNTLNGIRALVVENPERARSALTSLGNILSGSIRMAHDETVTLGNELDIVRDYLSLQRIRFEDRLGVEFDIDEDTLLLPVPILMLQTLVENAVKHGISRRTKGGLVRIVTSMKEGCLELVVQNTGRLTADMERKGFGWSSTSDRLALLYESDASFSIKETDEETVEAKVIIPVMVLHPVSHDKRMGSSRLR